VAAEAPEVVMPVLVEPETRRLQAHLKATMVVMEVVAQTQTMLAEVAVARVVQVLMLQTIMVVMVETERHPLSLVLL
jgi:hypothetical protein